MSLSSKSDVSKYEMIFATGLSALRLNRDYGFKLSESTEWKVFQNDSKDIVKFSLPTRPIGYEITEKRLNDNLKEFKEKISSEDYDGAIDFAEKICHDIHSVYQDV